MNKGIAQITSMENHRILTLKENSGTEEIPVFSQADDLITEFNVGDWVYIEYRKEGPVVIDRAYYGL